MPDTPPLPTDEPSSPGISVGLLDGSEVTYDAGNNFIVNDGGSLKIFSSHDVTSLMGFFPSGMWRYARTSSISDLVLA